MLETDLKKYIPLREMFIKTTVFWRGNQLKIMYVYPNRMGSQSVPMVEFTYCNN